MSRLSACLGLLLIMLAPLPLSAEEYVVAQQGRAFEPKHIDARIGDVVVFVNDDEVSHTVYSETPGFDFSIGKQKPGEQDRITLERAGEFEVRCAIHPRMKLTVAVAD